MRLLADMEVFVAVARLRHFGRAAAALEITASTLSRRVAALELELGVVLIRRSTRSFNLTESGEQFFERSRRILDDAIRTREEISVNFAKLSGHLRAGMPSDLAATILAPVIAKYCRENPAVSIDLIGSQGQPDLSRDRLDVAFAVTHQNKLADSSYLAHRVGSFARMMYASRTYLKRKGVPNTPQELQAHACIRYLDHSAETNWELHSGRKRQRAAVNGPWASSSVIASAQAAREHLGIAMLPQHLASHPTFGAGLIRVLPVWEGTPVNVFALTADRVLPARIQELIRVAKADFAKRVAQLESVVG